MANIFIIPLAAIGLIIASYIYSSKRKNKKMACALGGSCNVVTGSKYSKTFGIPNELGGILYFMIVIILAVLSISGLNDFLPIQGILIGITSLAVLFSLYLLGIQAFILKKWCEYCITSSIITILILVLGFF